MRFLLYTFFSSIHSLKSPLLSQSICSVISLAIFLSGISQTSLAQDSHIESKLTRPSLADSSHVAESQRVDLRFNTEILLNEESRNLPELSLTDLHDRIGFHGNIPQEYVGDLAPRLDWQESLSGELHASFAVTLVHSESFRVKMRISAQSNLTIRYSAIEKNGVAKHISEELVPTRSGGSNQLVSVWSPSVQSGSLGIEFVLSNTTSSNEISIQLVNYSTQHLRSSNNRQLSSNTASLNRCEGLVDAKCAEYAGLDYKLAAVGRILVEKEGEPIFCTGTLLNSRDPSDDPLILGDAPAPYLLTSHSCVSTQAEADSLEITWFYEHEHCGQTKIDRRVVSTYGGGDLLSTSIESGFSLVRLRNNPPGGLVYSGWRGSRLAVPSNVQSIHHPNGDVKKVSSGMASQHQANATISDAIKVEWDYGGAERGSDGAGLFYNNYLVGTLVRSDAFCEQSVSHFSTFASYFPQIRGYLLGDHSDVFENATRIQVPISIQETLLLGDTDYYQFVTTEASQFSFHSEGDTDTFASLLLDDVIIDEDDNSGMDENFLIQRNLEPGTYTLKITGGTLQSKGRYRLHASLAGGSPPTAAPTNVRVESRVSRLGVSWDELSSDEDGGAAITGYRAVASNPRVNSRYCSTAAHITQCEVSDLTPGLDYAVSVYARNTYGQGPASNPLNAVPLSLDESKLFVAPTNVQATLNHTDGSILVRWDGIPTDSGRAEVVSYTAEAIAESHSTECETSPEISSCILKGFQDGVTYRLTVFARSAAGNGPRSDVLQITPIHTSDHSDSQTNARNIALNSRTAAYLEADDSDYFRFSLDEIGSIHLWSDGDVDTYARFHSGSRDLQSNDNSGQGSNFAIRHVLEPGEYYLQITQRHDSSGYYTLSASFVPDDHGNGRITATLVNIESETPGHLAYADEDYFRLDIEDRGTLHASTHGDADTRGSLQSETEDLVFDLNDGPGSNFNLWHLVEPATYYIQVRGEGGSTGDYLLGVSLEKDDHGDSQLDATIIELVSEISGFIARGDEDYFRLDIEDRGTLHVSTHGDADTRGSLQSETNDLTFDLNSGPGSNFSLWHVVKPGSHYIRVRGEAASTGAYVLHTSFDKDDHGDHQSSATELELNSSTNGFLALGDVDYFKVELSQRGIVSFTTNGEVDTRGDLESETEDIAKDFFSGPDQNFSISVTVDPGVYFLRISGEGSSNTGRYTLITTFESEM